MKLLQCIALTAIVATGTFKSNAAPPASAQTNWVSNLNFTLTAWRNGASTPAKASSKDVIASFNGTHVGTNVLNFPATSRLLLKQVLSTNVIGVNSLGTNTQIIVRKVVSGKNVDTDISSFFDRSTTLSTESVSATTSVKHDVGTFSMENSKLSFALASFTTQTDMSVSAGHNATKESRSDVSGSGTSNGTPIAIAGTIEASGGRLE